MDALPLISVIVPVYKVEKYLDKCVQSIVDQTYQNLEIILVDDGSPDRCGVMCDAWAAKDTRIRVIHKENGGLSDARNAGLKAAKGERIGFVDSDDWIAVNMYELLYTRMIEDGSDLSVCGVQYESENGETGRAMTAQGTCCLNTEEALRSLSEDALLTQTVWNKLYTAEQIRSIPFPVGRYHEDAFWTYQVIAKAKRVSVFDTMCYHYVQRSGSITCSPYSLKRLDAVEATMQMHRFLRSDYPQLVHGASVQALVFLISEMRKCLRDLPKEDLRNARAIICGAVKEIMPIAISKNLSLKRNMIIVLTKISFEGTCRLLNAMGHEL